MQVDHGDSLSMVGCCSLACCGVVTYCSYENENSTVRFRDAIAVIGIRGSRASGSMMIGPWGEG
jgi:hypothetical protein